MKRNFLHPIPFLVLLAAAAAAQDRATLIRTTLIYDDIATPVELGAPAAPDQLWVTTADLTKATRFEVKPQGVCREELCFPLPKSGRQEFLRQRAGGNWFNLAAFARLVHQPVAHDDATSTWYFGLRSDQRQSLTSLHAPDFTLPDPQGRMHSLSDFRGKKVLLVTWASW
ncbi:MAG: redoxin domain-containing protein [Acidobacteria bacterium]|nr:redoxin domain-containing protein [Acidobacteriota bacterium]